MKMPSSAGVCRVCLATDVRMLPIGGALQSVYEKLAGTALHADRRPEMACYICHSLLHKARRLMLRVITAEKALGAILIMYPAVTKSSVSALDRHAVGLCPSLVFSRLEYLDNIRHQAGATVKIEHVQNHVNGKSDSEDSMEAADSTPSVAASDVESERDDQPADSSTEPRAAAEDVEAQSSKDKEKEAALLQCRICARSFKRAWSLRQHLNAHIARSRHLTTNMAVKRRPLKCPKCPLQFARKDHLEKHMGKHAAEKQHICNVCHHRFRSNRGLRTHMRKHSSKYECHICPYRASQLGNLKAHMKTHTGKKVVGCDVCQIRLSSKHALVFHMRLHTDELHRCVACRRRFASRDALLAHLETHEPDDDEGMGEQTGSQAAAPSDKPHQCTLCPMQFSLKIAFRRHVIAAHF